MRSPDGSETPLGHSLVLSTGVSRCLCLCFPLPETCLEVSLAWRFSLAAGAPALLPGAGSVRVPAGRTGWGLSGRRVLSAELWHSVRSSPPEPSSLCSFSSVAGGGKCPLGSPWPCLAFSRIPRLSVLCLSGLFFSWEFSCFSLMRAGLSQEQSPCFYPL